MSSFGGTVKLSGESEYRKALGDISSNLKVLNSELKSVTSEYDKNDTSVENLSKQNEVLNKKIDEQEKKVSILKDALEQSKKETGESSESTKKWQTELNNAQAELNTLNRKVNENKEAMNDAERGTKEEAKAVEEFGKEADKSGEKALSLGDIIKANLISDAIKSGLSALVDGFKAIGNAMGDCLAGGAAYADNLLTLSAQTGLSTDTLEKYNAVAELTDVSLDTLTSSMAKNVKAMSEARDGSEAYATAYSKLGVSVADADGNLRDSETVYWETIDALKGIENETERDALAMELFGKKAQDLNTIIEMGSEGVAEYADQAVSMGAVLGGNALQSLGKLDDEMQIFKSTTSATKNILATAFAPAMSDLMGGVNGVAQEFNQLIIAIMGGGEGDILDHMEQFQDSITAFVENAVNVLPKVLEVAESLITNLLQVVADNLPTLLTEGAKMLSSLLGGIANNLGTILPVVMDVIMTIVNVIIDNLPTILKMGIEVLVSLVKGISASLPTLIPTIIDAVILMVETLLDNIDLIIDAGIELVLALAMGLVDALPQLVEKIPVIIDKIVVAVSNNLPKILEAGITILLEVGKGLIKAIPQLLMSIPTIIISLVEGFLNYASSLGNIGKNIVEGIWEGISNGFAWIKEKITGWVGNVLSFFKKLLGIKSPSKVFKEQIGENLALGVGEGFTDTMTDVTEEMAHAIPTEFDTSVSANFSGSTQMSQFDMMVCAFKTALTDVKVVMDDREMGTFVTDTVERVVFA